MQEIVRAGLVEEETVAELAARALGTVLVCLSICLLSIAEFYRRRGIARTGAKDTGGFL